MEQLGTLDLRAVVRASSDIALDAGERLRLVAVYLDENALVYGSTVLGRWEVFARIYDEARRLSPANAAIPDSRAITALGLFEDADISDVGAERLWAIALESARTACDMDSNDAGVRDTLGRILYFARPGRTREALAAFEEAIALDSEHAWAKLYRAHCLHDLQRWAEAAEAYGAVNAAAFAGVCYWRIELLREQRAYCQLKSGDRAAALAGFEDVLARKEAAIARGEEPSHSAALFEPPRLLAEASEGALRAELFERVSVLVESVDGWESLRGTDSDA